MAIKMLLKCRFHFSLRSKPQTLKAHIFQNMHKWPKKNWQTSFYHVQSQYIKKSKKIMTFTIPTA